MINNWRLTAMSCVTSLDASMSLPLRYSHLCSLFCIKYKRWRTPSVKKENKHNSEIIPNPKMCLSIVISMIYCWIKTLDYFIFVNSFANSVSCGLSVLYRTKNMLIDIQRSLYDIYNNEMLKKIKRPYPTSLTKQI